MSDFKFKKFTVRNEFSAMKINTDGVMLGAWVDVSSAENVLDIGTGTGIIAIMAAQRICEIIPDACITGIDIDEASAAEAEYNFINSVWNKNLCSECISLQKYIERFESSGIKEDKKFSLIVSNPPYFKNSLQSPQKRKNDARHAISMSDCDIVEAASKMLLPDGRLALILPFIEGKDFIIKAKTHGLFLLRECLVSADSNGEPKRIMMEFGKNSPLCILRERMNIYENGVYSNEYKMLTKEFYLSFF